LIERYFVARGMWKIFSSLATLCVVGWAMQIYFTRRKQRKTQYGPKKMVIFSGGSAFNPTSRALRKLRHNDITYIIPTTDDGGSSKEIIRYFGGPAIGDIRSRLLRLASVDSIEEKAVKHLLELRIQSKEEWHSVLNSTHQKWDKNISDEFRRTILRFLRFFEEEVQKRQDEMGEFNYRNGSVGNFFFTGARLFFQSLSAAIFWWSRVARIPEGCKVIPAPASLPIDTEIRSFTIGAELMDQDGNKSMMIGQSKISHPIHPETSTNDIKKISGREPFGSGKRIYRLFYVSRPKEKELTLNANPRAIKVLEEADVIVYGIGSLFTSIIAAMIPTGMGERIQKNSTARKVLVLNGSNDRETFGFTAIDYVKSVALALSNFTAAEICILDFVNCIIILEAGLVPSDIVVLENLGLNVIKIKGAQGSQEYDPETLAKCLLNLL